MDLTWDVKKNTCSSKAVKFLCCFLCPGSGLVKPVLGLARLKLDVLNSAHRKLMEIVDHRKPSNACAASCHAGRCLLPNGRRGWRDALCSSGQLRMWTSSGQGMSREVPRVPRVRRISSLAIQRTHSHVDYTVVVADLGTVYFHL